MFKDYFFISLNNLKERKLRSWLTMIGIFIGIAAVIALIVVVFGFLNHPALIDGFWVPIVQETVRQNFILSFFVVMIILLILSLGTNYMTKLVTDVKRLKRYQAEVDKHKQQESIAKKLAQEGNPKARKLMIQVGRKKK